MKRGVSIAANKCKRQKNDQAPDPQGPHAAATYLRISRGSPACPTLRLASIPLRYNARLLQVVVQTSRLPGEAVGGCAGRRLRPQISISVSVSTIPSAIPIRLVAYVRAIFVIAVTVRMIMPRSWMVLMKFPVRGSVGAMPVLVLARIVKAAP